MSRTQPRVVVPAGQGMFGDDTGSRIRRVRVLAKLLDNSISIPGTHWKFGFDAIIGLVPVIGDFMGAILSGYIVLEAARSEIPRVTLVRMLVNVGIDALLGAIPGIGDVFDAVFKANIKNVALLEHHLVVPATAAREKRKATATIVLAVLVLLLILAAGLALGIFAARLLWGLFTR
ncbi:MAG TPA: DUF4112 domain-containing protein [Gemmatimonadaceae bacterium]|nr:DUF4112 domain-containing protein [Gemmatimonadaceae bacterium]